MSLESALTLHAAGNLDEAERAYRRVLANSPFNCLALEKLALVCLATGRAEEGRKHLNNAIKLNPKNAESYVNLGVAQRMLGNIAEAISSTRKAISLGAEIPEAYLNLGDALKADGQSQEATSAYEKAIALNPKYALAYNALGVHFLNVGQLDRSLLLLEKAVAIQPDLVQAHHNLGLIYQSLGRVDQAISACQTALALHASALTYANLGNAYQFSYNVTNSSQMLDLAVQAFHQALEMQPDLAEAYNNLGQALREQNKVDEAISTYKTGLQYHPNNTDLWLNLALVYDKDHKIDDAHACYERVLQERCKNFAVDSPVRKIGILLLELLKLPSVYKTQDDLQSTRGFFCACLNQAATLLEALPAPLKPEEVNALRWILFLISNFYVSYQQMDDKSLMVKYAQLSTAILRSDLAPYLEPIVNRRTPGKIRVGVASSYLNYHHGSAWAYGWLANLPRDDYEFYFYSLNGKMDQYSQKFASLGPLRWLAFRESNYLSSLQAIKNDCLDILLLPYVGMSPASRIISLTRLAPIQCVGWGHPGTTGAANVDYFISNELMEPEGDTNHYSETLVKFKGLGLHLEYPADTDAQGTREQFGLPPDKNIYGTVQSIFKYLPRYDFVFAAIAKRDPSAFFVFVASEVESETSILRQRLRRSFEQEGINFDECAKIIPRTSFRGFMELLTVLDVNLDCIGWNGGYTTMQSLSMNLPLVTSPGEFMRGRMCQAMLKAIGVEESIGQGVEEYIEIAVQLGTDSQRRAAIVEKIKTNKHKLFNDVNCVGDLDSFWKAEVKQLEARPNSN